MQIHSSGKYFGIQIAIPQGQGDDGNPVMHDEYFSGLQYLDIVLRDFNFITLHVHMYDSADTLLASVTIHKNPDLYTVVAGEEHPTYHTLKDYFMTQNPALIIPKAVYFKFEFVTETVPAVSAVTKNVEIKYFSSNQSVCQQYVSEILTIKQNLENNQINNQQAISDLDNLANNGPSGGQAPILLSSD